MAIPRPEPGTGKWWAIGIIGCTAGVALISWGQLAGTADRVIGMTVSYRVVDAQNVTVTFDVHKRRDLAAVCTVRALDERFGTVGSLDVAIPPVDAPASAHTVTIRTTSLAVTGEVQKCRGV